MCLGILGHCYFMLSVPVQLTAWEDRPQNDQLCVEREYNVKQLLTHSLTCSVKEPLAISGSYFPPVTMNSDL